MAKRKTDMQVRVNREVWNKARASLIGMSDAEISKVLFNTSIIRVKDPVGNFVFGKKTWPKFKPITKNKIMKNKIKNKRVEEALR